MLIPTIKEQILADLNQMTPNMQRQAAHLVHNLVPPAKRRTVGQDLLRFAGTIDPASAKEMADAIAVGCGQIEPDTW